MEILKVLEKSNLFSHLSRDALWRIADLTERKNFKAGDFLIRMGKISGFCYIIETGLVEVSYVLRTGKKFVMDEAGPGALLGELSIIDGLPPSADVMALEDTNTLTIGEWDFKAQMQAYPEIALQLLPIVAQRLRNAQDQLMAHKSDE